MKWRQVSQKLSHLIVHFFFGVQVLLNMFEFGMNPQEALDAPRFCIQPPPAVPGSECSQQGMVVLEEGISDETMARLKELGHCVMGPVKGHQRKVFGRGQIIQSRCCTGDGENVWWAGSDGRGDGMAIGY